jgi:hypothetical protein
MEAMDPIIVSIERDEVPEALVGHHRRAVVVVIVVLRRLNAPLGH